MGPDPLDDALTELERGRRERAVVVGVVIVALATAVVLVVAGAGGGWSAATAVAGGALLLVVVAHVASLVARERAATRATRALVVARAARAADESRERTLGALHAAARRVTGSLELAEVVDRSAHAAAALVDGADATLLLRVGEELAVAAAVGPAASPRGTRRAVTSADRAVIESGETVVGGRGGGWGGGPATITAPLALPERIVGTLVVRREAGGRPFGEDDRLAVALLAEHVALALRNATALDRERQRSEAFRSLIGEQEDGPEGTIATTRG